MTSCSFVSVVNFLLVLLLFCLGSYFFYSVIFKGILLSIKFEFHEITDSWPFFLTYKKWQFHVVQFKSGTMLFLVILKLGFIGILFLTNFLTFNFTASQWNLYKLQNTSQFSVLSPFDCYHPSSGLLIFYLDYVKCISSWLPVSWHICQFFSVLSSQAQSADLSV